MTHASIHPAHVSAPDASTRTRDLIDLCKPSIVRMVGITAAIGFAMAMPALWAWGWGDALRLVGCIVGVCLAAGSANALNQAMEAAPDALMRRTADRPVASGRISQLQASLFALALGIASAAALVLTTNVVAALIAVATIAIYAGVYTPLKRITSWSLHIGAVPGALPPLIGWIGAQPDAISAWHTLATPGPWVLFALMLIWQVPHVLAIAVRHREDYARASYRFLPVIDPDAKRWPASAMGWSITLVLAVLVSPLLLDNVSGVALVLALPLAAWMGWRGIVLVREATPQAARSLFFASLAVLPGVLAAFLGDAMVVALLR